MLPIPPAVFVGNRLGIQIGMVVHAEQKVAVSRRKIALEGDCPAVGGDGLVEFSHVLQRNTEIAVGFGGTRDPGQWPDGTPRPRRPVVPSCQRIAEIAVRLSEVGPQSKRLVIGRDRLIQLSPFRSGHCRDY